MTDSSTRQFRLFLVQLFSMREQKCATGSPQAITAPRRWSSARGLPALFPGLDWWGGAFLADYCNPSGRISGVLIADSSSLIQARFRAGVSGADNAAAFCEGHELDAASAALGGGTRKRGRWLAGRLFCYAG